jgi:hypothetical protein
MPDLVRNAPFTVQIEHDQVDTDRFDLYVNGQQTDSKPVDPAGVQFVFPAGLVPGSYTFEVEAVGPAGAVRSDAVVLVVTPGVPSKPRLVIVVG